jgi:hypothetical protein
MKEFLKGCLRVSVKQFQSHVHFLVYSVSKIKLVEAYFMG